MLEDAGCSNLIPCDNVNSGVGWEVGGRFKREGPYVYL